MTEIRPQEIKGPWTKGYVLDLHSTQSIFLGYNELGHPEFDTQRTELGELLYRLKYRGDETALVEIGDAAESFIRTWGIQPSLVVPVPPSASRTVQPVFQITDEVGTRLRVPVTRTAIRKRKQISELKNIYDLEERRRLLGDAFAVSRSEVREQRILVVDDLYRSGATLEAVTRVLMDFGATTVYVLALTRTRSKV
jgi:competence protein ComFC